MSSRLQKTNMATLATKYPDKLRNMFSFLENPEHPSLGPHLYFLSFVGLWHPTTSKTSILKQMSFYICVLFFFSQYLKCIIHLNPDYLKLILQYIPFHMGIVKACFFHKDQKLWAKLICYTAKTEQEQMVSRNKDFVRIINEYIGRNRKVTYFFWIMAFLTNVGIFSEPYLNSLGNNGTYEYIFDGYTPFSKEPPGYYAAVTLQTVLGHFASAYVVGWDMLVVSIMIFYAGQLKIARVLCRNIIDAGNENKSHDNIVAFHRYYINLIKYQKLFNFLISRVMFVYLVVISVNLGVCIIEIAHIENDLASLVSKFIYVEACLIQLLIFYWHANEVTVESMLVDYAVFESNWTSAGRTTQKEVALLGMTATKRMVFNAGPVNEMSLATFAMILRASYSFYTLMNETY